MTPDVVVEGLDILSDLITQPPFTKSSSTSSARRSKRSSKSAAVFISHNWKDKAFAKRLAEDLEKHGARVWFDTAEMRIGESIISKIADGIESCDFLAVILSPHSVDSYWVQTELRIAMTQELNLGRVKVLPLLYQECQVPSFLSDKLYADFRSDEHYDEAFDSLLLTLDLSSSSGSPETDSGQGSEYENFPVGFFLYSVHYLILAGVPFGFLAGKLVPGGGFNYVAGGLAWILGIVFLNYCFWKESAYGLVAILLLGPSSFPLILSEARADHDFLSVTALGFSYLVGCVWLFAAFLLSLHSGDVFVRKSSLVYKILAAMDSRGSNRKKAKA